MLIDALEAYLTPASPLARRFGFVHHSVALKRRALKQKAAWATHITNCQTVLRNVVDELSSLNHIVILGSSHLFEVDKQDLLRFKKITLVDLVHPLSVRRWAKKNPQVQLIEADLSGYLAKLQTIPTTSVFFELLKEQVAPFYFEADLVVSSNLLSQLHLTALTHLERKSALSLQQKNQIGQLSAENHLRFLKQCPGKHLVYSDRQAIYFDQLGNETGRSQYPVDFGDYSLLQEWQWDIAPLGEAHREQSIAMLVQAYID